MQRALVIGANGYIGRHIAFFLNKARVSFVPADLAPDSIDNYPNYQSVDVTDPESVKKLNFQVDVVFMFAGLTGTKSDEESVKRYTAVNEGGLKHVLDRCLITKPHVVFPSSRLIYKGQKDVFLKEGDEQEAKTIYAQNKINCERLLEQYYHQHGISSSVFRICVPYGNLIDTTYSYGTLGFFLTKALNKENITLFGDGKQRRTFTHVSDIVNAMFAVINNNPSGNQIFNIGSPDALSLVDVASWVAQKYKIGVDHIEWPAEALSIESGDTIFSDEKLLAFSKYTYQYTLKAWINSLEI